MKNRRLLLALLMLSVSFQALGSESPVRTVEKFYAWAIRPGPGESGMGLAPVQKLLGQELLDALEKQRIYEAACTRLVPVDVKPYMLDQSPFFLWPDKAKSLVSVKAVIKGDTARVSAQLAYEELRWTDTVVLHRRGREWVIVNIEWQESSLTKRLVDFASHRCAP